jgi:crotonobetainyl-CoA:carnitine CoA-transferase CaiB-like acyl-CoA transferase
MVDGRKAKEHRFPPALGEHADEVLRRLGYDPAAIEELRRDGVV